MLASPLGEQTVSLGLWTGSGGPLLLCVWWWVSLAVGHCFRQSGMGRCQCGNVLATTFVVWLCTSC